MAEKTRVEIGRRADLGADCANCAGLCCVALAFARSADFGHDKDAGEPCMHLEHDFRCRIHPELRQRGYAGCTVFDCFGAGQKVTQQTFGGDDWRDSGIRGDMFAVFPIVRRLQQLLWYLDVAIALPGAEQFRPALVGAFESVEKVTLLAPDELKLIETDDHFDRVRPLLMEASTAARSRYPAAPARIAGRPIGPRSDLLGARLRNADLRGADLRAALLIGADLRGANMRGTDVIGADFRDADLRGADLSSAIYLTQVQANSAKGDARTRLPVGLAAPSHWAH